MRLVSMPADFFRPARIDPSEKTATVSLRYRSTSPQYVVGLDKYGVTRWFERSKVEYAVEPTPNGSHVLVVTGDINIMKQKKLV